MHIKIALPAPVATSQPLLVEDEFPLTLRGDVIGKARLTDVDSSGSMMVLGLDVDWRPSCPAVIARGGLEALSVSLDGAGQVRGEVVTDDDE